MSYSTGSPLVLTGRPPSAEQLWAAFAPMTPAGETGRVRQALAVLAGVGAACRCDPVILAAIAWIETGEAGTGLPWRSRWWLGRNNIGNLGVTGDPAQDAASQRWQTPHDGAVALVAHYVAYAWGSRWRSAWDLDALGLPGMQDKRFQTVLEATGGVPVKTLGGLSGRWSTDMAYGDKLAERCNALMTAIAASATDPIVTTPATDPEPIESEQTVTTYNYDNGIEPPWSDYPISDANKYAGWIDPKNHFIAACVLHSAYGSLNGSSQWFAGGNALTDCMVGNSYDGPTLDGALRRFNDAYGSRYSWASGPVANPIDDAAKFLEIFGPNKEAINMYTTALERSNPASGAPPAVTPAEHAKRVAWVAWHANRYGKRIKQRTGEDGFTCDTFPLIPAENNRSFLIYHGEINADKRNTCPDAEVRKSLDKLIADVRTVLAGWQRGTATIPPQAPPEMMPEYAKPIVVPELEPYKDADTAPSWVDIGGKRFVFVGDRVRAIRQTPRRQTASEHGENVIGPPIEAGLEFGVNWLFWEKDGAAWFITPYWTRVKADDVVRIGDTP